MNKMIANFKLSHSGMTMVEVVVSTAIVALSALILAGAFGSSLNVVRRGVDSQSAGNSAFTAIEEQSATDGTSGQMRFEVGGQTYTVDGRFLGQSETENGVDVTFHSFEATEP